jgi:hypothetical protein
MLPRRITAAGLIERTEWITLGIAMPDKYDWSRS